MKSTKHEIPGYLINVWRCVHEIFNSAMERLSAYRTKRRPSQWAVEERILAQGDHTLQGGDRRYTHELAPHCIEQMDSADDPTVNTIVIWAGVRDFKTTVCLNISGRTITDDPGGIYDVFPTEKDRDVYNSSSLEPTIEATPVLKKSIETARYDGPGRNTSRTKDYKKFPGGWLRLVSAGSLTAFRGTTVKQVNLHELDALDQGSIQAALNRTQGFADAIRILESTGTIAAGQKEDGSKDYNSRIEEWYDMGDRRNWFCRCRECGKLQTTKFSQIQKREKIKGEEYFYVCEFCGVLHNDKQWRKFAANGVWLPTAGLNQDQIKDIENNWQKSKSRDATVRSYWRNGFANLLPAGKGYSSKLHQFYNEEQRSHGSKEARKKWIQEIAAELWSEETQNEPAPAWLPIYNRRLEYGLIVPEKAFYLTAFADVQKNRIEVGWRGWGRNQISWGMDHTVLEGYVGHSEVWVSLRKELARKFKHATGAVMGLGLAFVDGGAYSEEVYKFFQGLSINPEPGVTGHCQASKGIGAHPHPIVTHGPMKTIAKTLKGRHLGTWQAKDRVYDRLKMEPEKDDQREGLMFYNMQYSEEYFRGLTIETATQEIKGSEVFNTYKDVVRGNEPLDIEVGCLAAVLLYPKNWYVLEAAILVDAKIARDILEGKTTVEKEESSGSVVIGGYGGGWRI